MTGIPELIAALEEEQNNHWHVVIAIGNGLAMMNSEIQEGDIPEDLITADRSGNELTMRVRFLTEQQEANDAECYPSALTVSP